jgi:hypothetical protein
MTTLLMLVVDLMHEFEIGVWKTLFTHVVRVLYAASKPSGVLVDTLNERYCGSTFFPKIQLARARFRQVPTFGLDTIRQFRDNISEMKKLAAHDYEDLLQV